MKTITIIFLLNLSFTLLHAQFEEKNTVYLTNSLAIGNYAGIDVNLNYISPKKYSFKVGYSGFIRKAQDEPEEYSAGIGAIAGLFFTIPYEALENCQVLMGKVINLNKTGTVRLNLAAGIGFTRIRDLTNWKPYVGGWEASHTYDVAIYRTLSIIVNPKIEFPVTRFYGLTISPIVQINKETVFWGLGVGEMIGMLRQQIRRKK